MKHRPITLLVLGLLLAASAHAEILHAEGVEAAGQIDGLALRLLELQRPQAAPAWEPGDLRLDGANVTLEAWYEDSGGTPVPIDPTTERSIVYEGHIDAFEAQGQTRHYLFLYADAAEVASTTFVDLQPHDKSLRSFPNFVARTGAEEDVPLQDTLLAGVPDQVEITVAAPFTLALWNWNITFDGVSGKQDAWSGTRPHGAGTSLFAPFGFDAQLLVMRVHDGTLTLPVPAQDVLALQVLVEDATVVGTITTPRSWLPGARDQAEGRIYVGNHSMDAYAVNDTVLRVAVEPIEDIFAPPTNGSQAAPQGQLPKPGPAKLQWLPGLAAIVVAVGSYAILRTWQWHVLVSAFRAADYGRVAAKAGSFHRTLVVRGRAQTMTIVSALKLGQHQFVLDNLDRMNAMEGAVATAMRRHALEGLGLDQERGDSRPPSDRRAEIDSGDASAAYS